MAVADAVKDAIGIGDHGKQLEISGTHVVPSRN